MLLRFGTVFLESGVFAPADIAVESGRIACVGACTAYAGSGETLDLSGKLVVPGLIDIHLHGAMGADFSDGTEEAARSIAAYLAGHGVTSFLGTTMSLPEQTLMRSMSLARAGAAPPDPARATLRGIHMEGPFLSLEKRGAQKADYIRQPDWDQFVRLSEASGGNILLVDVAPELPGALAFIEKAAERCVVSLAHTNADYDTASAAYRAGATHATHLFNGMRAFSHRQPGAVGAALDFASHVELICDGVHVHPSVVRLVFAALGPDRVCLISDSMRACGMPDGKYDLGGQSVLVRDGQATIDNGSLAGSVANLYDCMKTAVSFGIPRETAVLAATRNPALAVGIYDRVGSIRAGKAADLLILNEDFSLSGVMHNGVLLNR